MTILELTSLVGRRTIDLTRNIGRIALFLLESSCYAFAPPFKPRRILDEIVFIGARSVTIIIVVAVFTGMVLGLQSHYSLRRFGSEGLLGSAVALAVIRELGPVMSALMVAGRAGSSMAAQIGIMKLTEQIDALEMMAVNPVKYIVTPKVTAGLLCLPLLTALFDVVGIMGGYLVGVKFLGGSGAGYFDEIARAVRYADIWGGFVKSFLFGPTISWVCCYTGYRAVASAEGVAAATTRAVVVSSVTVLILDYILTAFML